MRCYKVFCGFCEKSAKSSFIKLGFVRIWILVATLFMPLSATQVDDFAKDFEALFKPKLQKDYRILSVFGEQELELHIQAILNSKVLIHDKWYKIGDKIGAYHIYSISQNSITLIDKKSSQKILRLKTKESNQNLAQTSSQAFSQKQENQISLEIKPISSITKGTQ